MSCNDQNERFIATSGGECTDTAKQLSNARQKGEQRDRRFRGGEKAVNLAASEGGRASLIWGIAEPNSAVAFAA